MLNQIEADAPAWSRHPGRERQAGRIRPAAVHHRAEPHVRQDPDRQPRRDRAAHPARLPRAGHQDRGGAIPPPIATSSTCGWPTRRCASARRRRPAATSTCRRSSAPPRSPTPTPSIPATASCPRTPTSPSASRRAASSSSARTPETIRLMGDKVSANQRHDARHGVPCVPGSTAAARAISRREPAHCPRHRLPGDHQGLGRRRRPRHARGAYRSLAAQCHQHHQGRGARGVQQSGRSTWRGFSRNFSM